MERRGGQELHSFETWSASIGSSTMASCAVVSDSRRAFISIHSKGQPSFMVFLYMFEGLSKSRLLHPDLIITRFSSLPRKNSPQLVLYTFARSITDIHVPPTAPPKVCYLSSPIQGYSLPPKCLGPGALFQMVALHIKSL